MKPYMPKFTAPKPAPKEEFRLGLASVSFRNNTQREILEAMRGAGLTHIEWGSDLHAPHKSLTMLAELAEMQKQYGIVCSSYGTYFRLGENSSEDLLDYIKAAKLLGTRVLRVWAGRRCGAVLTLPETEKFMHACEDAAEIAEAENVKICLECHLNTFTERLEDTLMLMDNVGTKHFGMYWQPLENLSREENLNYLKKIEPYVENLHVLNCDRYGRHPLSDAVEDWRIYISALSRPRTMLLEFMPDDLLTTLPREAEALKKIIL